MTGKELAEKLSFEVLHAGTHFEEQVQGGYTSDLLSDVMGNIGEGMVWITLQVHRNVIAVAALREVGAIVLVNGARVDEETLALAREEGVTLLSTSASSFETSGRIYELLR